MTICRVCFYNISGYFSIRCNDEGCDLSGQKHVVCVSLVLLTGNIVDIRIECFVWLLIQWLLCCRHLMTLMRSWIPVALWVQAAAEWIPVVYWLMLWWLIPPVLLQHLCLVCVSYYAFANVVAGGIMFLECLCIRGWVSTDMFTMISWVFVDGIWPLTDFEAVMNASNFGGKKVKGHGHGGVKYAPKCTILAL